MNNRRRRCFEYSSRGPLDISSESFGVIGMKGLDFCMTYKLLQDVIIRILFTHANRKSNGFLSPWLFHDCLKSLRGIISSLTIRKKYKYGWKTAFGHRRDFKLIC